MLLLNTLAFGYRKRMKNVTVANLSTSTLTWEWFAEQILLRKLVIILDLELNLIILRIDLVC